MSTILKTCKYLSIINRKYCLLPQLQYLHNSVLLPVLHCRDNVVFARSMQFRPYSLSVAELSSNNHENQDTRRTVSPTQLDQCLSKLDSDARKYGRLNQRDVENFLSMIKQVGSISGTQSLLLIRGCGSFLPEMPKEKRRQLVEDVWNTFHNLRCSLDVSHYNALLKVYLENEHDFDPIEFLSTMEKRSIQPNRVTYQRLVSHYCQNGDMDGASQILEFMKSKDLPMNELIFNDLIMGNVRGNNIEDGRNIIGVMRNAEMPIRSSTYASLACGFATLGDITNVLTTIQEASSEKAPLQDRDILNIIYTLTVSNHEHLVEQVLPHVQCKPGYTNECIIVILELLNKGYHKVAFTLLQSMPRPTLADGSAASSGTFFIRQMAKQDLPPDVIINYCNKMKDEGLNDNALLKATEMSLRFKNSDSSLTLLKELHSQGYDIQPHFFWPVLACKRGNEKDFYDILKLMLDMNCPAEDETFILHFFPYVSVNDPYLIMTQLKDIGYEENDIAHSLILFYLQNGDTQTTAGLLEKYSIEIVPLLTLSQAYIKSQDQFSTIQILQHLYNTFQCSSFVQRKNNIYGEFLYHLSVSKACTATLLEDFFLALEEKGLKLDISHTTYGVVTKKLEGRSKINLSDLVQKLSSDLSESKAEKQVQEKHIRELAPATRASLTKMLLFHAKHKNLEQVQEILKQLDELNFTHNGVTYSALIELYNFHKDLDKALYYKGLLDKQFPEFPIKEHTIINLANTLVQNKQYNDAESLITTHHCKHGVQEEEHSILYNISELLFSLANSDEPERTQTFFDTLVDLGYCSPKRVLLKHLIQVYLSKNNTSQAAEEFLRIVNTYKCTPLLSELLNQLILKEDAQTLQRVTDAAITVHGEANVLIDLVMSFINCGRLEQAKQLIETPGIRIRNERMENICNFYVSSKKVKEFETFIHVTKNIFGVNRGLMYHQLLRGYVNDENVEQALNVWVKMQEEDIQPSDQTLQLLGKFLQKKNQPVPFVIPDLPAETSNTSSNQTTLTREVLEETNLTDYLTEDQRKKMDVNSLSVTDISMTIKLLLGKENLKEALKLSKNLLSSGLYPNSDAARLLAIKLSEVGDKDSLLQLQEKLPEKIVKNIPFKDYIANAYINSGQANEFLESLENEVFKYKNNFPGGGLLALLSTEPGTLDRVRKLADLYYQDGSFLPRNMLWIYLMNNHKFEEAEKVFETTPEMKTHLYFESVIKAARKKNDVEVSQRLLDQAKKSTLTNSAMGLIYSTHIILLIAMQKVDEALTTLKELQTVMNINDLSNVTRTRLTQCLKDAGVGIPFVVPQSYDETSSSSSDDDK